MSRRNKKKKIRHDAPANSRMDNLGFKKIDVGVRSAEISSGAQKNIDKQLEEIYENGDGSMPDMTTFEMGRKWSLLKALGTLAAACAVLAAVIWIGFFVMDTNDKFSESSVTLGMTGDESVRIGQEARYKITYFNGGRVPLGKTLLQVKYPEGFILTGSDIEPVNEAKNEWALGAVPANKDGTINLKGYMYGDVGAKQSFRLFLNYIPANFNAEFQSVASLPVEFKSAPLVMSVTGPDDIISGREAVITIKVKPAGDETVKNVAVVMNPGGGFIKKSSAPASDQFHEYQWNFNEIKNEQTIAVKGVFLPDSASSSQPVAVQALAWKDAKRAGDGFVLAEQLFSVPITASDISTRVAINGATADLSVQPGESLTATMVVKNNGSKPVKHVTARLVFDAPSGKDKKSIINWSELNDALDGVVAGEQLSASVRRGSITWREAQYKDFLQLDPGESANIDIRLPLKAAGDVSLSTIDTHDIQAVAEAQYEIGGKKEVVASAPIHITINSDFTVTVSDSSVTDGDKETHNVSWTLNNTWHDLKDIRLEAELYGDFVWQKDQVFAGAGEAAFDERTKKLVWTIPEMPSSVDVLNLQFPIVLQSKNPTQTNLTSKIKAQATDTVTGQQIIKAGDEALLKAKEG